MPKSNIQKLYIIHGWTYKPEPWHAVINDIRKQGIEAELLLVPGLGAPSTEAYTIDDYIEWANNNLPQNAIALGHSNGGRILLNMLAKYGSQRLKGLILLDSAGIYEKSLKTKTANIMAKAFAPLKKNPKIRKIAHKLVGANDYSAAPENMKLALTNMLESDKRLNLTQITTPTRIIWGSDDKTTPLRQGKKIHAQLQNSKLIIKAGWRHSHYLVSTKELADEIVTQYKALYTEEENVKS